MSISLQGPPAAAGRLFVVGASGFIGGALVRQAIAEGISVVGVGRDDAPLRDLAADDVLAVCAIDPNFRVSPYRRENDLELRAATVAAERGSRVVMLSSRRVYPESVRFGASESDEAGGDETQYGRNKAQTERSILGLLGERACVLRLGNVFGFEYVSAAAPRGTFFGMMLSSLKERGEIVLDVQRDTRRDFVPLDWVAPAVLSAVRSRAHGILNVGSGHPVACGDIAEAVIEGFGRGQLRSGNEVRDEFYLSMKKWSASFGAPPDASAIIAAARRQGERLRDA